MFKSHRFLINIYVQMSIGRLVLTHAFKGGLVLKSNVMLGAYVLYSRMG